MSNPRPKSKEASLVQVLYPNGDIDSFPLSAFPGKPALMAQLETGYLHVRDEEPTGHKRERFIFLTAIKEIVL